MALTLGDWLKTIFGRSKSKKVVEPSGAKKKPRARVVRVGTLREGQVIEEPRGGGWAYFWREESTPQLGQRVLVPFGFDDELEEFVIIGFGRDGYDGPVKSIITVLS